VSTIIDPRSNRLLPDPQRGSGHSPASAHRGGHAAALALILAVFLSAVLLLALLSAGIAWAQATAGVTAPSPMAARPAPALRPLDRATRAAIVDSVAMALQETYVFPDTAAEIEAIIRGRLGRGEYDGATTILDVARTLTEDLQSVNHDRHLGVRPLPPPRQPGQPEPTPEEQEKADREEAARNNFGFEKVEHLAGNVGYLDLRGFLNAGVAGKTAMAAMTFLGNCDALIFDLRQNGGGDPSMIQLLCSYLFEEPTHLNDFHIRRGNRLQQFWTPSNTSGPDLSKVPVWVLTSSATFSGAEEFSYDLKNLKRATIVGETTGGGAHPIDMHVFPTLGVEASVPFGRAVNPVTGTNWEGIGVEPDLKVPADKALGVAHLEALKTLRARATDPDRQRALAWALEGLEMSALPVALDKATMLAYEGTYGPRRIWIENGELFYQRAPQPPRRLVAAGNDRFLVEGVDFFRIRFEREGGRVRKLVGLYGDGRTEENPRD
jgi:retinol-binding protein 3